MLRLIVCLLFVASWTCLSANAQEFRIVAWNVESNRPSQPQVSDATVIGQQLTALLKDPATRAQLIALSEVEPKTIETFRKAAAEGLGSEVDCVSTGSGGYQDTDTLVLIADKSRFEINEVTELHRYAGIAANFNVAEADSPDFGTLRARSPLAAMIIDKKSNKSFWLIVNHLARGEAELRTDQARMLGKWAEGHPEPIITAGDFNFDYDFRTGQGNEGFKAMLNGGVWQWLKPDPLVDSNWSDDRNIKDRRVDRYPDSLLDFVFVANQAKEWQGEVDVIVRDGDFPDSDQTSDHRPIIAVFHPK